MRASATTATLLKWAGGNGSCCRGSGASTPQFNRYVEPFFGSGAVFFDLHAPAGSRDVTSCCRHQRRSDRLLRDRPRRSPTTWRASSTLSRRRTRATGRRSTTRCATSSSTRCAIGCATADGRIAYTPRLAAMLIYLNRTGFNGLFRLNARGEFNVPAGRYERPKIADREKLARVADGVVRRAAARWSGDRSSRRSRSPRPATSSTSIRRMRRSAAPRSFTSYTARRFGRRGSAAAAAAGDRAGAARLPRAAQQLDRRRDRRALRTRRRAAAAGLQAIRVPARRADQPRRGAPRPRRRIPDHERPPAGVPGRSARRCHEFGVRRMRSPRARLETRSDAKVAELADAPDLGSGSRKAMGVRLPPFAQPSLAEHRASVGWQARSLRSCANAVRTRRLNGRSITAMKTEFVDVNETRKNLASRSPATSSTRRSTGSRATTRARRAMPGFRPGKAPARVVKQRFKDQILHDVAHELIPRAVDEALRERGVEPVDTPDIRDVIVEEGQPLTFTAIVRHGAAVRSGRPTRRSRCSARRRRRRRRGGRAGAAAAARARGALRAGRRPRRRARRHGLTVDLTRADATTRTAGEPPTRTTTSRSSSARRRTRPASTSSCSASSAGATEDLHDPLSGRLRDRGAGRAPTVTYTRHGEGAASAASCRSSTTSSRRTWASSRSLDALRARVREDLEHEAKHAAEREMRAELMKQLATRCPSRCRRRCSSARSIGGRGVRAPADRSADRSE